MRHDFDIGSRKGPSSGQVQAQAARSVALLTTIELTVTRLTSDAEIINTLVREFREFLDFLVRSTERTAPLDPEGRACDLFEQASSSARRLYNRAVERRNSARRAHELTPEDGVEDAYDAFVAALADIHNVLEDVRDTMATLDAEQSPVVGTADSHEGLMALLKG